MPQCQPMLYKSHEEAVAVDPRYGDVKLLIDAKRIVTIVQVFSRIKRTTVALALGIKLDRFNVMLERPGLLKMSHIENMATLFGVSIFQIVFLLYNKPVSKDSVNIDHLNRLQYE